MKILSLLQHIAPEHLVYYVPCTVQDTDNTVWNKTLKALPTCSIHYSLMGETDSNKSNTRNLHDQCSGEKNEAD